MSIYNKPDGIYEELISEQLKNELSFVDEELKYTEKIDPEEAPAILA